MENIEVLERTMKRIELGADHCQTNWCRCFAGNALLELGFPVMDTGWRITTPLDGYYVRDRDGVSRLIKDVAQRELGLTDEQRIDLFAPTNTQAQLRAIVNGIVARAQVEELIEEAEFQLV